MEKDENIVEEGTVEEEDMLLDFDLDDLTSEEGAGAEDDDDIIELVDFVEEDESQGLESGESADDEIARLLENDTEAPPAEAAAGGVEVPDEFENMLDDVDLDETEADIDMSDVALDLDFGSDESEDILQAEPGEALDVDLDSMLGDDSLQEAAPDLNATYQTETQAEAAVMPPVQEEATDLPEPEGAEEVGISDEDLQRMLEDDGGVNLDLELPSEEPPVEQEPLGESEGEDITEEALERMLEDEVEEEPAEEPLSPAEEAPPIIEEALAEEETPEPPPPATEAVSVSEERIEEIVRSVVEDVVTRELGQTMADVAERVIRESVTEAAERVIRETIEALKASLENVGD